MTLRNFLFRPTSAQVLLVTFFMGTLAALVIGLEQTLHSAEDSIRPLLVVSTFLQAGVSEDQAKAWGETLRRKDAEIQSLAFISKDQALQEAQKDPALAKSLMILKDNPLPASFLIHYSDRAWLERSEPVDGVKGSPEVQEVRWDPQARSVFRSLQQWRAWLIRFSGFAGVMLLVWALVGMYRFLAMRARPDLLLGQLLLGLCGGALSVGIWAYALRGLGPDAGVYRPAWFSLLPIVAGITVAIGCFGWDSNEME